MDADVKPPPRWAQLAVSAVRDGLGVDLAGWPSHDKIRVFVAALDAEPAGEVAIENAAIDTARAIRAERRRARTAAR